MHYLWHMDDIKLSHVESSVVYDNIDLLYKEIGQDLETPLAVHISNTHDYLVMTIIYNTKGKSVFTIFDYIQDVLDESPD